MHNNETKFEALYNEIEDMYLGASKEADQYMGLMNTHSLDDDIQFAYEVQYRLAMKQYKDAIDKQLELLPADEWQSNVKALNL